MQGEIRLEDETNRDASTPPSRLVGSKLRPQDYPWMVIRAMPRKITGGVFRSHDEVLQSPGTPDAAYSIRLTLRPVFRWIPCGSEIDGYAIMIPSFACRRINRSVPFTPKKSCVASSDTYFPFSQDGSRPAIPSGDASRSVENRFGQPSTVS